MKDMNHEKMTQKTDSLSGLEAQALEDDDLDQVVGGVGRNDVAGMQIRRSSKGSANSALEAPPVYTRIER